MMSINRAIADVVLRKRHKQGREYLFLYCGMDAGAPFLFREAPGHKNFSIKSKIVRFGDILDELFVQLIHLFLDRAAPRALR